MQDETSLCLGPRAFQKANSNTTLYYLIKKRTSRKLMFCEPQELDNSLMTVRHY